MPAHGPEVSDNGASAVELQLAPALRVVETCQDFRERRVHGQTVHHKRLQVNIAQLEEPHTPLNHLQDRLVVRLVLSRHEVVDDSWQRQGHGACTRAGRRLRH